MRVCKFGGTSLADASQIRKVCDLVLADADRRIVVVSAPGKRAAEDRKVTDLLIEAAEARLAGNPPDAALEQVVARFAAIASDLGLPRSVAGAAEADLRMRAASDPSHRSRYLDLMKAGGEDNSARLVAAALCARGERARYVSPREAGLLLSDEFGNAQILPESYSNLAALRDTAERVVFPGFFGHTRDGATVTFPRGGSDITGSILAAAVGAEVYENFTDVDFVFAADPRIVPGAGAITELSYREMRELSYAGFTVLHDEAIVPVVRAGIPIWIRNTNRPDAAGTRIVPHRRPSANPISGIASADGFCVIYVDKYLMNRELGFGRRLLQILEDEGISYEHAPSGIDSMSVLLRERELDAKTEARVCARIRSELAADDVEVERELALIMIVGEGMRHAVGTAARATGAFAAAGVNIELINQGSSEISMMFGVKAADRERAVRSLYAAFFGAGPAAA